MIRAFKILLCLAALLAFFGCEERKEYGNVHYDRDVCEHCKMAISDKHFSVDVLADGKNHYFDDIGCMVEYAKAKNLDWIKSAKIYINDASSGEFIDAREAYYYFGFRSPMAFGWAAFKNKQDGKEGFDFEYVVKQIQEKGHSH